MTIQIMGKTAGLVHVYHKRTNYHFLVKPRHWRLSYRNGKYVGELAVGPFFLCCWFR